MSNAQKSALIQSLANFQANAIADNEELTGKALPCHVVAVDGSIVKVQFDILPSVATLPQVTIPVFGFEYIRYPIQIGDKGVTIAASVSLRGVSGLGVGMADMSRPPSLTALFFMPIANAGWSKEDPNKIVFYGPDGAILKTADGASSITVEPGKITQKADALYLTATDIYLTGTIHLNGPIVQDPGEVGDATATFIGPVNVTNDVVAGGVSLMEHPHDVEGVEPGGATIPSKPPTPGAG